MSERNRFIDFIKYVAAIMVIAIHSTRTFGTDSSFGFIIINVFCRMAVPFFAVCSGYFLSQKLKRGGVDDFRIAINRQFKKLVILYCGWTIIYLIYSIPGWISTGWFSPHAFLDYGVGAVRSGSHYHLWYLLSLIFALPLYYFCVVHLNKVMLPCCIIVLWGIKVILYVYLNFLPASIKNIIVYLDEFKGLRDAIFLILPLLLLGTYINSEKPKPKPKLYYYAGFAISFGLLLAEAFLLKKMGYTAVSYIIFTLPVAYYFFNIILNIRPESKSRIMSKIMSDLGVASITVYCLHPIISEMSDDIIKNNILHFLLTAVLSTVISLIYIKIKKLLIRRKNV